MIFGTVPVADAVGAISVHGLRRGDLALKKGALITAEIVARLRQAGIESVVAARLEAGDVGEDEAARRLAVAAAGPGIRVAPPFTGRANLFAERPGLLRVSAAAVDAVNVVDEAITLATLPAWTPVVDGEMVGTVKIIPYAAPEAALAAAIGRCGTSAIEVAPYRLSRIAAISTLTSSLKPSTVRKTIAALSDRLVPAGAALVAEATCPHEPEALTAEMRRAVADGAELVVVFGASAIADRRDVIPAALGAAGGHILHFGMPVDPGNLLLLGRIGGVPVIGAPGCARSPKENGFDWVLRRCLAGIEVTRGDIAGMGVGGLLKEIGARGQPRAGEGDGHG